MTIARTFGEPVACTHPRAKHQHGSHVTYKKDRCHCQPCTLANRRYEKVRDYQRTSNGGTTTVRPDRARAHVEHLIASGVTIGQIERRSGVHRTSIRVLIGDFPGRTAARWVSPKTERQLLTVKPNRFGPEVGGTVDQTGTARRVQALAALGWSLAYQAAELGMLRSNFQRLAYGRGPVLVSTRNAVAAMYDRLWDEPPPTDTPAQKRSRAVTLRRAQEQGWPAPLAWNDDTIDDPAAEPEGLRRGWAPLSDREVIEPIVVDLALSGTRVDANALERAEILRRWKRDGRTVADLNRLQGWNGHRDLRGVAA